MNSIDFGLGILASWLANQIDKISKKDKQAEIPPVANPDKNKSAEYIPKRLFRTFDVYTESEVILNNLIDPVAHFVVENSPSTFYNLAALVVESKITSEWFVFRRGRIAFQGGGGGYQQAERIINILQKNRIPIATWALDFDLLENFEKGYLLWPAVKISLVPLYASMVEQEEWERIKNRAKEMLSNQE